MSDLNTTTQIVRTILEADKQARNSDSFLYLKVLEHVSEKNGVGLYDLTVPAFLTSMDVLDFPALKQCAEAARRSRQLILNLHQVKRWQLCGWRMKKSSEHLPEVMCDGF